MGKEKEIRIKIEDSGIRAISQNLVGYRSALTVVSEQLGATEIRFWDLLREKHPETPSSDDSKRYASYNHQTNELVIRSR